MVLEAFCEGPSLPLSRIGDMAPHVDFVVTVNQKDNLVPDSHLVGEFRFSQDNAPKLKIYE
jgi:hypothetical protein